MKALFAILLAIIPAAAFAQGDPLAMSPDAVVPPAMSFSGLVSGQTAGRVEGTMTVVIPPTWHINSARPVDAFAIPTTVTLDPATAAEPEVQYPQHEMKGFGFTGGNKIAVYEGTITIPFKAKALGNTLRATLRYQACDNRVCLPPKEVTTEFSSTPAPAGAAGVPAKFTPLSAAPKGGGPATGTDRLSQTFASSGLPLTLVALFVLGMALNLTPCVFPMIPITVGFFAMQSDGRRSRRLALSSVYVLGLVVMYSSLGVVASLGGKLFGAWLQRPSVQVGFALLMIVLASSMFGAFDIGVPRFIANRAQGRAGLAGAMTMGMLVGIVAAPCVGPVVVSLITLVASIGRPSIGFVMFAALALGLGFPYLVMLNALPRPGEWMVQVKKAMGFVLVAMAFYFLRPIIGENFFRWGVAASLLVGAAFLFLSRSQTGRVMRLACGALLLVAGAAFAIPRGGSAATGPSWTPYDAKVVAAAAAQRKPVVIDFYADWCIPCKELDEKTFSDPRVTGELARFVRLKVDLTRDTPGSKELTRQFGIVGVPTIVFIDSDGREITPLRLTGFEEPAPFFDRAKQAR